MSVPPILTLFQHRGVTYPVRVIFSPLTRARATREGVTGALQAEYYRQRASAALIISEAIAIVPEGRGGCWTPGLYTDEQVEGWRLTTEAVHAAGGRIYAQLWHAGRLAHSCFHPGGLPPVSPVAVAAQGSVYTETGRLPYETPRALCVSDIEHIIASYRRAAENALRAGFDGIEIHSAHGYLLDSFLRDAINNRDDRYGGSLENRARFLVEVMEQMVESVGADRIAVRISPETKTGGIEDSDPLTTFGYVIDRMNDLGIAWLDMVEGDNLVDRAVPGGIDAAALTSRFNGAVILNHGYTYDMANEALAAGRADMIAFGRAFVGNPDLVERFRANVPLVSAPASVLYGGGAEGLIDFPPYSAVAVDDA